MPPKKQIAQNNAKYIKPIPKISRKRPREKLRKENEFPGLNDP